MSGRLVSIVFDSALPTWLKLYAAAFATFAADDGSRVFPSVARVARMVGRSERSTQRALHELRARGVLTLECGPGHHRAPRYQFRAVALGAPREPDQLPLFPQAVVQKPAKTQRKLREPDFFHTFPQALTRHPCHPMGDTGVTRSVNDPSFIHQREIRAAGKGEYPKTGTRDD